LRTYVCSAVLFSAGAVEATANQVLADAAEHRTGLEYLGADVLFSLAARWKDQDVRRGASSIEKIQLILDTCGRRQLSRGSNPLQDADTLFRLRNALVHFVPEWASSEREHARIEAALRSKNLRPNPFSREYEPTFPGRCLSADLAAWGVRTAYDVIAEFYRRMQYESATRSWSRLEYYTREFGEWESYARWEGDGGPPWRQTN
jgi:hypothetical protein